jgi:DNA polymerase eta
MSFFGGPSRRQQDTHAATTYRHLLSSTAMTAFNPLRTIGHCDIDGAFAQFEQVRLGLPDDVPLVAIQWNSIIAVNYPARAYGIKRDMSAASPNAPGGVVNHIEEAKKRCPGLVVQHVATYRNGENEAGYWPDVDRRTHKVSLDPYRRESLKILAIFREMAPKAELEKASIDEAFMDLTPMVIDRLLQAHPHLATVPPDAPDGLDSLLPPAPPINWSKAGNIIPIDTEGEEPPAEETDTWQDWALCIGAEIMADVRAEVWKQLHYTCSAGIAHNKAMAKVSIIWSIPSSLLTASDLLRMEEAQRPDGPPRGSDLQIPAGHGLHRGR